MAWLGWLSMREKPSSSAVYASLAALVGGTIVFATVALRLGALDSAAPQL